MNNEIARLEEKIKNYSQSYYEGTPEISDEAFDMLVEQLRRIDPNNPILEKVGWGYTVTIDPNATHPHRFEVAKFEDKIRDVAKLQIKQGDGVITPKLDGGSVCCYYTNGKIDYAITRGDGINGFDVTEKLKILAPATLVDNTFTGMVRGEITMSEEIFNENYSHEYDSNRNLAIGLLRRKESTVEEVKALSFVAYTVRGTSDLPIDSKTSVFNWLKLNGFECVDVIASPEKWDDDSFRCLILGYRELNKYPIDGIVITSEQYKELKDGTFVPVCEMAYKTLADSVITEVEDIEWSLTRTGRMVPVICVHPTFLSGAWVSRATAFNASWVRDSEIGIGGTVRIQRSGEVIPNIIDVIEPGKPNIPEVCPSCGEKLEWVGTDLKCTNIDCGAKGINQLKTWVNTIAPVKGLGGSRKSAMYESMGIDSVSALYDKIDSIVDLAPRFTGPATVELFKAMVQELKGEVLASTFFVACSIPGCGKKSGEALGNHLDLILNRPINQETKDLILDIKGANINAKTWVANHLEELRMLAGYPKRIIPTQESEISKVSNKKIAVTGKLSVTRSNFFEEMAHYGYSQGSMATAQYLVTNNPESNSSKMRDAKKHGVIIISENEFRNMIGAPLS